MGPITFDKNGNIKDYEIWLSELNIVDADFEDYINLRSLELALRNEIAKRAALREKKTSEPS